MRSMIEARALIYKQLAKRADEGRSTTLTDVHFVLCEDGSTIMIYADVVDEQDAAAIYFDLGPNEEFQPQLHRHEFFKATSLVLVR